MGKRAVWALCAVSLAAALPMLGAFMPEPLAALGQNESYDHSQPYFYW